MQSFYSLLPFSLSFLNARQYNPLIDILPADNNFELQLKFTFCLTTDLDLRSPLHTGSQDADLQPKEPTISLVSINRIDKISSLNSFFTLRIIPAFCSWWLQLHTIVTHYYHPEKLLFMVIVLLEFYQVRVATIVKHLKPCWYSSFGVWLILWSLLLLLYWDLQQNSLFMFMPA